MPSYCPSSPAAAISSCTALRVVLEPYRTSAASSRGRYHICGRQRVGRGPKLEGTVAVAGLSGQCLPRVQAGWNAWLQRCCLHGTPCNRRATVQRALQRCRVRKAPHAAALEEEGNETQPPAGRYKAPCWSADLPAPGRQRAGAGACAAPHPAAAQSPGPGKGKAWNGMGEEWAQAAVSGGGKAAAPGLPRMHRGLSGTLQRFSNRSAAPPRRHGLRAQNQSCLARHGCGSGPADCPAATRRFLRNLVAS